jgi:uncharacterized protein YraI
MPRLILLTLILTLAVVGCSSQPTPTPTPPPPTTAPTVPTDTPTPTSPPPTDTPVPTAVPPTATPTTVIISGTLSSNVNVRETPSLTAKILGQLSQGDSVVLVGRLANSTWLEINYPPDQTTTGWVLARLIQTTVALDTLPAMTTEGTPVALGTEAATPTISSAQAITPTLAIPPTTAATATPTATASSAPAGSIIYDEFENGQYHIYKVRADGTGRVPLLSGAPASQPALSPSGAQLAYHKSSGGLAIANLDGSNERTIATSANASYPTWSADGNNLAYQMPPAGALSGQIHRVTRDGTQDTLIGIGVRPAWQPGSGQFVLFDGCSPNGGNCGSLFTVSAFNGDPNNPTLVAAGIEGAWSPNGSEVAYEAQDANGHRNIFIANATGSNLRQITKDTGNDGLPTWSANGQWLFYRTDQNGTSWAIYAIRVDGTGARKIVDAPVNADQWIYEKLALAP